MIAALTGTGLSAAAGLNAWIPFLIVALVARYTDFLNLPSQYSWIESSWAIGISAVLLFSEVVLDKVAVIDNINDLISTAVRPTIGALIFSATSAAEQFDNSMWVQDNQWFTIIVGAVVAGVVHGTKTATRPAVNMATAGMGGPVVSTVEDGLSVSMSVAAVFMPILILIVGIPLMFGLGWLAWKLWFRRRSARTQ